LGPFIQGYLLLLRRSLVVMLQLTFTDCSVRRASRVRETRERVVHRRVGKKYCRSSR
jgi:hypothetical protein